MTDFPSQDLIIKAILDGITKAKNNFLFWTNDRLSLSYGPHKIVTIHVAQEIAQIENAPEIFINATVTDILRCSLPKRDQFLDFMNTRKLSQGTFSITLDERFKHQNDNDSISRVIISVINNVINTKKEYLDEIDRICKMISRDKEYKSSTLDYGVFSFYSDLSDNARKKLDKRIPELIKKFDKIVANYENLKATFKGGEIKKSENNGECSMGCYIIEPFYK
jgi:predicted nucleic acid-binding OB-fold protein